MRIIFLLSLVLSAATAAILPKLFVGLKEKGDVGDNFIQNEDIQRNLMTKAAVPSYAREFLKILQNIDPEELLERLLEGVQGKECQAHSLELIWRLGNLTELTLGSDMDMPLSIRYEIRYGTLDMSDRHIRFIRTRTERILIHTLELLLFRPKIVRLNDIPSQLVRFVLSCWLKELTGKAECHGSIFIECPNRIAYCT